MKEKNSYIAWEVNLKDIKEKARITSLTGGRPITKEEFRDFLNAVQREQEDSEIEEYQKNRRLNEARKKPRS